ncbi:MAG TPA: histidine kinase, partial [Bacilli bacterium]
TYEQKIVGVLRIDLNGARLKERLDELKLDGMGEFYITDREGKVLVSEEDKDVGHSLKNEMWFKKYKSGLSPNGHFTVESDGAKWLGVYHEFQSTDWVLIGRIPLTRILQGVNQARNETMSIGALSLVIAMILIIMISAGVTRPLSRLQESMKQVELGNFDAAVPYSSRDEIGFLGLSFNKMTREIKRLIAKIYETELIKKDAEIKALQSQINPHFLYNTLSTLDSLVALHGDARIGLISRGLGEMFRYSISGSGFATVDDEINHVKLYLSIQQVRYEDRLNFSIEVEPGLGEVPMPKLLLQPIVENAVKHGIERKLGQGFISIRVNTGDDNLIQILVEDDGAGMDDSEWKRIQNKLKEKDTEEQQAGERRSSMGLQNISQRIQLLYGEQFKLHITSIKGEGTKVGIILPQINKGDEQGD